MTTPVLDTRPGDRLIVATCRELEMPLLTHDRLIMRSRLVQRWRPAVEN